MIIIIMWLPFRCSPSRLSEEGTTSLCTSQHDITGVVEQTSRRLRGPLVAPEPCSRLAEIWDRR